MRGIRLAVLFILFLGAIGNGCSGAAPGPEAPPAGSPPRAEPAESKPVALEPATPSEDVDPIIDNEGAWEGEAAAVQEATDAEPKDLSEGETRTMAVIRDTVLEHRGAVRACYDAVQSKIPTLKGDLTIHFVINPQGVVKMARLNAERSTLKNAELVECAIAEVKNIRFPPSSKGLETKVDYPFNFNPR